MNASGIFLATVTFSDNFCVTIFSFLHTRTLLEPRDFATIGSKFCLFRVVQFAERKKNSLTDFSVSLKPVWTWRSRSVCLSVQFGGPSLFARRTNGQIRITLQKSKAPIGPCWCTSWSWHLQFAFLTPTRHVHAVKVQHCMCVREAFSGPSSTTYRINGYC